MKQIFFIIWFVVTLVFGLISASSYVKYKEVTIENQKLTKSLDHLEMDLSIHKTILNKIHSTYMITNVIIDVDDLIKINKSIKN